MFVRIVTQSFPIRRSRITKKDPPGIDQAVCPDLNMNGTVILVHGAAIVRFAITCWCFSSADQRHPAEMRLLSSQTMWSEEMNIANSFARPIMY